MRDRIDPVSLQTLGALGDVVLSTDAINAPFRAGTQAVVGRNIGESRWQIDGTYLYMGTWDDAAAVRDTTSNGINTGNMFSPFSNFGQPPNNNGFDYNDFVSIREFSQLQSAELNLRYTMPMLHECLTAKLILGLRYMCVNEQFDYYSHSNVPVISPRIPTILGSSVSLTTLTKNDLFGPQIGGEFYFYAYPQCWIDLGIKGALCDNRALQDTNGNLVFGINSNAPVISSLANSRGRDATAFVGDLDVELVWQLTCHLTTRIGYQAIWVNNLALATRNFDPSASLLLNGPPQIDTIGRAVYHGPHIGLEVDW
jgi:hypothetical protein